MNTNSRFRGVRVVLVTLAMLFGLQHMLTGGMPTANAAPLEDVAADVQKDVASGDLSGILQLLFPVTKAPAKAEGVQTVMKPTAAALDVNTPKVTYVVAGTGGGADASGVVQGDTTYLMTPYPGAISSLLPAPLGPVDYGPSVSQAADQAVANAKVNPQPVNTFQGFSQGASGANDAAARDGQPSHIIGYGSPDNEGTGFRAVMPNNLVLTQLGTPAPLQAGDRADLYSQSGDCWTNMPAFWQVLSLVACIPSTGATHYGDPGYNDFHEDAVYESSPGVVQHVDYTENGLVIGAEDWLHLDLTEDQKQFLRTVAPQGQPGIQQGPTLREIVEDPAAAVASTVDALVNAVPAVAPQAETIPQAQAIPLVTDAAPQDQFQAYVDQGTQMIEDFANGTGNPDVAAFVDNTVNTVNQVVDSFTAPAVTAPAQDAAPAPAFTAPVGDLGDLGQQINDTVNQFTGGNTGIDLGAIGNGLGLFAGAR